MVVTNDDHGGDFIREKLNAEALSRRTSLGSAHNEEHKQEVGL